MLLGMGVLVTGKKPVLINQLIGQVQVNLYFAKRRFVISQVINGCAIKCGPVGGSHHEDVFVFFTVINLVIAGSSHNAGIGITGVGRQNGQYSAFVLILLRLVKKVFKVSVQCIFITGVEGSCDHCLPVFQVLVLRNASNTGGKYQNKYEQ